MCVDFIFLRESLGNAQSHGAAQELDLKYVVMISGCLPPKEQVARKSQQVHTVRTSYTHTENSLGNSIDQTSLHVTCSSINRQVYDHPSLLVTDHYPLW